MKLPTIISNWTRIVYYRRNHLNDFCIFRDGKGTWHAIGILGTGSWKSEKSFFHCTSVDPLTMFKKHKPIMIRNPTKTEPNNAPQKHAPFVVTRNNIYFLFYRRPPGSIYCTRSTDPFIWEDLGKLVFQRKDARDICIVSLDNTYLMYYCQSETIQNVDRSCILLRTSKDLEYWSEPKVVYCDKQKQAKHSYLESPFMVIRPEGSYLFVRNRLYDRSCTTIVLYSKENDRFPDGYSSRIQELNFIHAPEIIDFKGKYYIARVSGAKHANPFAPRIGGWIDIARLHFK